MKYIFLEGKERLGIVGITSRRTSLVTDILISVRASVCVCSETNCAYRIDIT